MKSVSFAAAQAAKQRVARSSNADTAFPDFQSTCRRTPMLRYIDGRWREATQLKQQKKQQEEQPKKKQQSSLVSVMSFNVWFDALCMKLRIRAILRCVKKHQPDFVGLQEVTQSFLKVLRQNEFVQKHYFVSHVDGHQRSAYGVVILSKHAPDDGVFEAHSFPTTMGRELLVVRTTVAGQPFAFATSHLESLQSARVRHHQLHLTAAALKNAPNAVFCGDFNFSDHQNFVKGLGVLENSRLKQELPDFVDVWAHLRPNEAGFTFDTKENAMLAAQRYSSARSERMRYDRIMLKSSPVSASEGKQDDDNNDNNNDDEDGETAKTWQPQSISMLGTKQIGAIQTRSLRDGERIQPILPSDHFGLLSTLVLSS